MESLISPSVTALPAPTRSRAPIRVLVVDDSVVIRQLVIRMLASDANIEVIGFARNGLEAVNKVEQLTPDLVTLDIEMPELDGVGALKAIKARVPQTRVIMCSSVTSRGAAITIEALMLGADDYVTKQQSGQITENAFETLKHDLLSKIRQLFRIAPDSEVSLRSPQVPPASRQASTAVSFRPQLTPRVLAIGVSTGGPSALAELLSVFPANFPLPILIVQHMPPAFTKSLAERLTRLCRIPVVEAETGMSIERGRALLAPGDFHMRVIRRGTQIETVLDQGERECFCRPSVDVLYRSVAAVFGGAAIATVLTGMGQDGLEGARCLKQLGATVIAQDKATSVVWGMPGAVASAGLADQVLPLNQIYKSIERQSR